MKKCLLENTNRNILHNWMHNYYDKIKNKTLKQIPIIGSNATGSYSCNGTYGIGTNSGFPIMLYKISKLFCLDYKFM